MVLGARWGELALVHERRALSVATRGVFARRREVPLGELQSVEVVPSSFRDQSPTYDLNLVLTGDRVVRLRGAGSPGALEKDRAAIADFLREHQLLWGAGDRSSERVRVAGPVRVSAEARADDEEETASSERAAEKKGT
jgi:hypothetical protein